MEKTEVIEKEQKETTRETENAARLRKYIAKSFEDKYRDAGGREYEADDERKQIAREAGFKEHDNKFVEMYDNIGYDIVTATDVSRQGNQYGLLSDVEKNPDGTYQYDDIQRVSEEHVSSHSHSHEHQRGAKDKGEPSHDDGMERA